MPPATRRRLAKVKSSAMTARQPSVPNLIWPARSGGSETGPERLVISSHCPRPNKVAPLGRGISDQFGQILLVQILHDFAYILRILPGGDQQSVFGLDHHNVVDPDYGDKFSRSVHVIPAGIQSEDALSRDEVAVRGRGLDGLVFVKRGPGAQVIPTKIGAQAEEVRGLLPLGRAGFQNGVVDADVFTLG